VCRLCLLEGRATVAEASPLGRSHLEETEVLTVSGAEPEKRLAPRDAERLAAVPRTEDMADRLTRPSLPDRLELACRLLSANALAQSGYPLRLVRKACAMGPKLVPCLRADDGVPEKPPVVLEEPDHLAVLLDGVDLTVQRLGGRLRLGGGGDENDDQGTNAQG
jgi:hypothetical protein